MAHTPAGSPDRSIPSLTSGAGALLQAPTLPSSSRSPAFSTAAPGLPAAEYFRTSTHPEREPSENFVCVPRALSTSWAGPGHPGGRLRVSGISQCTEGKPPRKSHPFDPLLQPSRVKQSFSNQFSSPDRPQGTGDLRGNPSQSAPSSTVTSLALCAGRER